MLTEERRAQYAEQLGLVLAHAGWSRMAGRVLALLMLSNERALSSADIAATLAASTGSVSTATRELVERGSVREVAVPGSRRRWFRAEDDVWASALAAQRPQLSRVVAFADEVAAVLGPEESGPRKQLENMRDHHVWLQQFHQRMYDEWTEHQRRRA